MSITEFLLARIAEDEGLWGAFPDDSKSEVFEVRSQVHGWVLPVSSMTALSPARMLAECAAKRAIMGLHEDLGKSPRLDAPFAQSATNESLRLLAAVYTDHPDYQQEWSVTP